MNKMKSSGIEWIGEIPNDWNLIKFKYVYNNTNAGEVIDKNHWNCGNEILYTCKKTPMLSDYVNFPFGKRTIDKDILLTRNATPYVFIPINNSIYSNVVQRTTLKDKWNRKFVKYALQCGAENYQTYGISIPSYNLEVWNNIYLANLPKIKQDKIAAFLDDKCNKLSDLINIQEQQIENLKAYKQSLITETVTRGFNAKTEMKYSGIKWIGEISETHKVMKLKYLLSSPMQYGANESGNINSDDNDARYIRITDITNDGKLKDTDKLYLPINIANPYLLKDKNILFARSGGTVGKSFLYKSEYGLCAFAGYLIKAECDETKLLPEYLMYYTQSSLYEYWKNMIFIQATIQNIGANKYSNMEIPLPNIKHQKEIVEFLDIKCNQINKLIEIKQLKIEKLNEYKKSLIYECVTGKKEIA